MPDQTNARKLSTLPIEQQMRFLTYLIEESNASLSAGHGLRCAYYVRELQRAIRLIGSDPFKCDDVDLENDLFWLSEE